MKHEMPIKADKKKLYAAVASLPCQFPRCRCNRTTQVSHSNQAADGKGMSLKAFPWRIAALCHATHVELDSGTQYSRDEKRELWDEAHKSTIGELFARGLIRPV